MKQTTDKIREHLILFITIYAHTCLYIWLRILKSGMLKTPVSFQLPKLNSVKPGQYLEGETFGNF